MSRLIMLLTKLLPATLSGFRLRACSPIGSCVGVARNWSLETMKCHSSHFLSIVWGQGNAPLITSLPSSCYMTPNQGSREKSRGHARAAAKGDASPWGFAARLHILSRLDSLTISRELAHRLPSLKLIRPCDNREGKNNFSLHYLLFVFLVWFRGKRYKRFTG